MIYPRLSPSHQEEEIGTQLTRAQWLGKLSITRKKTFLQEYTQSGKADVFLDMRSRENDDALEDADKAIIRFQRERQSRMLKKEKYTLSVGEADILTHHGVALSALGDLEDESV